MDSPKVTSFSYDRRFGTEMEYNSFDNRDFQTTPLNSGRSEMPKGIDTIAQIVHAGTGNNVSIKGWHLTHNNSDWVIKPDRSCGMELCSPVMKGWPGLKTICEVVDVVSKDERVLADNRCSLHVHVEVADCTKKEVAKILTYWTKCESVFLDSVPAHRKRNCYCQCIGMSDLFEHDTPWNEEVIIRSLGSRKYYTCNCFHLYQESRRTIEFRIAESEACLNPFLIKNWVRLLVHFVEVAKMAPIPGTYNPNNPMTGFCWLDPEAVFNLLGFMNTEALSKGMVQTRNWFLGRLLNNISKDENLPGVWSNVARKIARDQINEIVQKLNLNSEDLRGGLRPANPELLYSNEFK